MFLRRRGKATSRVGVSCLLSVKHLLCRDTEKCSMNGTLALLLYLFFPLLRLMWSLKLPHRLRSSSSNCELKCNSLWLWCRMGTEQHGVLQLPGTRWMLISCLKSSSAITRHRLAHFNQKTGCIGWSHAVNHPVACNPYFHTLSERGIPLWVWDEISLHSPQCAYYISHQFMVKSVSLSGWYLCAYWHLYPSLLCLLRCSWHYLNGWV